MSCPGESLHVASRDQVGAGSARRCSRPAGRSCPRRGCDERQRLVSLDDPSGPGGPAGHDPGGQPVQCGGVGHADVSDPASVLRVARQQGPCQTPDAGVFAISNTAGGRVGTACAGVLFTISLIDPVAGRYRLTPSQPIVLGGPSGSPAASCLIDFILGVSRAPTVDSNPISPCLQTTASATVAGDTLFGDSGRDSLVGGRGQDILFGGLGLDRCRGGRVEDRVCC
ncbi:hypothetical protein [Nocardioides sp.]|uniref:hypothetical protein n=1 Tax=Nocardioides sp. TaxID=35761 RepID=UPI00344E57B9